MSDIRIAPRQGYTVIPNGVMPEGISARAWGVYVYLLSRPPGWICRPGHLTKVFREGRDAIYTAIHELCEHGLMAKEQYMDKGIPRSRFVLPDPGNPTPNPENPDPGNPNSGNQDLSHSGEEVTTDNNQPPASAAAAAGPGTEQPRGHQPHPGTEKACCLVAAWHEGAQERYDETGERAFPTIIKRMGGQAKNMARDCSSPEDWQVAIEAARSAGRQGLWDLAQGIPVRRMSQFGQEKAAKVAEQDAIFAPSAERARQRMAEKDAKILAERERRAAEGA